MRSKFQLRSNQRRNEVFSWVTSQESRGIQHSGRRLTKYLVLWIIIKIVCTYKLDERSELFATPGEGAVTPPRKANSYELWLMTMSPRFKSEAFMLPVPGERLNRFWREHWQSSVHRPSSHVGNELLDVRRQQGLRAATSHAAKWRACDEW
jgi:hypothetical protein